MGVRLDRGIAHGFEEIVASVAAESVEHRQRQRARARRRTRRSNGLGSPSSDHISLEVAGQRPAEYRMRLGRGQEVAAAVAPVDRAAVVAELGIVEGALHETGEGDPAIRRRLDIRADDGGQLLPSARSAETRVGASSSHRTSSLREQAESAVHERVAAEKDRVAERRRVGRGGQGPSHGSATAPPSADPRRTGLRAPARPIRGAEPVGHQHALSMTAASASAGDVAGQRFGAVAVEQLAEDGARRASGRGGRGRAGGREPGNHSPFD